MVKDVRDCGQCFPPAVVRAGKAPDTSTSFGSVLCASNPALNPAPFSRWTLRDKAAQRRLALR